jgi:hypothetical protein
MQPVNATCQSQCDYAIDNQSFPQHIPTIETSVQSNVPNTSDYKVPKKNMTTIRCNHATSMPSMNHFTVSINDINLQTVAAVAAWNAANPNSLLPVNTSDPTNPVSPLFKDLGVNTQFSNTRVMPWSTYCDLFYPNSNKRPFISSYYSYLPCFNTSLLTYKDSTNEFCKIHLPNLFAELYDTHNNINGNTLDIGTKISLRSNLAPLTNLANFNGEFKAIDVATLYVELADVGFVRWNQHHLNLQDARPNVFGGVLVNIEHQYNIYQRIGDESYLLSLKVPFIVHLPNWVSSTQYSRTNYVLTMVSDAVTSLVESASEDTPSAAAVSLLAFPSPTPTP